MVTRRIKRPIKMAVVLMLVISLLCSLTSFVSAAATGTPATPYIAHNNWDGNANYSITFNIWWGNNATSYKLYENDITIDTGSLVDNSPNGQTKTFNFNNKANGTYTYKIDLSNSHGTVTSSVISVRVTKGLTNPIQTVATPTFNPASGSYTSAQNVTITCATADATIRYTTDGSEPTASSTEYKGAINVTSTTTLKAKAFKAGMNDSATATATYTIGIDPIETVSTPSFSPAGGTYTSAQDVLIAMATTGATVYYTTDGSEPTTNSTRYTGTAIKVSSNTTLKAKAFKAGMNDSSTATAVYVIDTGSNPIASPWTAYTAYKQGDIVSYNGSNFQCRQPHTALPGWEPANVPALWSPYGGTVDPIQTVATPNFNPAGGTYESTQSVTISCATVNAVIRYTTNGSEPTASSAQYTGAIQVASSATLKAKAFKAGMNDSATATASYIITIDPVDTVATPSFNPAGGTYESTQSVTIACVTAGAVIRYTTNGSEPTASSAQYTGAITVASNTTLKAKAFKTGMNDSTTATASYVINQPITTQRYLTGYWQNFDNGATCLKISDVPVQYNLIAVAFADATTTPGRVEFHLDTTLSSRLGGYTKQQFINDIAAAKARGQKVIISVGGELGSVRVDTAQSATNFANSVYELMQEYGFDGVDIDLENGINATHMGSALRQLHAKVGSSLIIAMAPQTLDMQNPNAHYFKLALDIKDILTIVNTQFYNSGSMLGQDGKVYSQGTVDFLTALAAIQLENGLRPDQVGLGLPASTRGAGSGYVSPTIVNNALKHLAKGTPSGGSYVAPRVYPSLGGAMTWSINWDALNNYNFMNSVAPTLASLDGGTNPIQTVATPSFNPAGGWITTTQNVSITCATSGAVVRYTLDGSTPTASSPIYTGPIAIFSTTTLKAKAFKTGMKDSAVFSATYTVAGPVETVATPSFSLAGGTYTSAQSVSISCATAGAVIRYTTNGSEPTASSAQYTGAVSISSTTTLKAKAFKAGMTDSPTATAVYTINSGGGNTTLQKRLLIGYWHTWGGGPAGGVPFVKLRDVDPNWDVINISFAEPVSAGSTNGKMKLVISGLTSDYTINDFKADVKLLQSRGKKVVLSIGGYEGYFSLTSTAAVNQFVSDIKGFVNEYGFDGIDIDLEQSSVTFERGQDPDVNNPTSPKIVNMISAIRQICNAYDNNFILSWAPETFYMQLGHQFYGGSNANVDNRAGVYLPMINALRDKTTYVHTQLYNSIAVTGLDGKSYSMGNTEAAVAMCEMLLQGFNVGGNPNNFFAPLRPDQIAIGVPSSAGAAGSGHISNAALQQAFSILNAKYPTLRGIMTWSINWDVLQNQNSFAISNGQYLDSLQ